MVLVQQILLPNLPTKSVSVMDNASFHKGIEMQKIIGELWSYITVLTSLFT
ncbi:hypothetical protein K737_300409 [Holospora undulata HU1]|uniref:Tc1-like transposase DDE domain-containing protein n=1 Tax=Holospora undulata HU1 TaxID=1321371 RepID=A0A061JGI4_9PROT|nr:hypothetical protein K737_300409 [Holospora undulata HU1]